MENLFLCTCGIALIVPPYRSPYHDTISLPLPLSLSQIKVVKLNVHVFAALEWAFAQSVARLVVSGAAPKRPLP